MLEKLARRLKQFTLDEITIYIENPDFEPLIEAGKLKFDGKIYTYIDLPNLNFELIEKPELKAESRTMFKDAAKRFLAGRKLTKNTLKGYKYQLKFNILPYFGEKYLDEITLNMIKNFMQNLRQKYSPKTVSNGVTLTGSILKWAFDNGFIEYNPYLGIKNPRVRYEK